MSAKYLWRAVCRTARAFGRLHAEQVQAWEVWAQANRAAAPAGGQLRWVATLEGRRLAGTHLPASSGISARETP